jgi:hypothetical protein
MVAFLNAAMSGTTDPSKQIIPSARRILEKSEALQAPINQSSSYATISGKQRMVWQPDIVLIERVVVKNARGHAFFEIGEPMMHKPESVRVGPLESMNDDEREEFENDYDGTGLRREVGSRMMNRLLTGRMGARPEGVYRYAASRPC